MKQHLTLILSLGFLISMAAYAQVPKNGNSNRYVSEFLNLTKAINCAGKEGAKGGELCFLTRNSILSSLERFCDMQHCEKAKVSDYLDWLNTTISDDVAFDSAAIQDRNESRYINALTDQFEFHCTWYSAHNLLGKNGPGGALASKRHLNVLKQTYKMLELSAPDELPTLVRETCPSYYSY